MDYIILIIHLIALLYIVIIPFITNNFTILTICLIIHITISMQWHIFGQCILTKLENQNDNTDNAFTIFLVNATNNKYSYEFIDKCWVIFCNYIPSMICIIKMWLIYNKSNSNNSNSIQEYIPIVEKNIDSL